MFARQRAGHTPSRIHVLEPAREARVQRPRRRRVYLVIRVHDNTTAQHVHREQSGARWPRLHHPPSPLIAGSVVQRPQVILGAQSVELAGGHGRAKAHWIRRRAAARCYSFSDQLAALRTKSLFQEVDRAKKQLELKQTEIAAAGLAATEGDQLELLRLQQQVQLADAFAKLRPDALAAVELKTQTDLVNAQRELDVARRQLQTETDLAELRAQIERLQAEWQVLHPGAG